MLNYFDALEMDLCLRINALSKHLPIRQFFRSISRLGDYPAYLIVGVACAAMLEDRGPAFIAQSLATAAAGVLLYRLLKTTLVRERPYIAHHDIYCAAKPLDRYSFPSGHTMHAVSFAILFTTAVPIMAWIMLPFAALVAASRVILGLHYPTDVLVGGLLGAALATVSLSIGA
ncbi:MAG: phosphatase PAP2 family protein [Woeseiaceae bacterium]